MVCWLAAAAGVHAASVVWRYPPPDSLVTSPSVGVHGYVEAKPGADLTARLITPDPGTPALEVPVVLEQGRFFSISIQLSPGKNDLVLQDSVLHLFYQPEAHPESSEGFRKPFVHADATLACPQCHAVYEGELMLNDGLPQLCIPCHELGTESLQTSFVREEHFNKITPYCIGCHDPHYSFSPNLMRREGNACLRCHEQQSEGVGHEGAAEQPCALCHDPHQSANEGLLKDEPLKLCAECHREDVERTGEMRFVHRPVGRGKCLDCHVSHSVGVDNLLVKAQPGLCKDCHPEVSLARHEEKITDCTVCHAAHRSASSGLLHPEAQGSCRACHEPFYAKLPSHDDAKEGCFGCHDPHLPVGEQNPRTVCGKCHSFSEEGYRISHAGLRMEALVQCVFCHESHMKTSKPGMLYGEIHFPMKNGGCGVCHENRKGDVILKEQGAKACLRCHGQTVGLSESVDEEKVHQPVFEGECIACHDPHLKERPYQLLEDPGQLCQWCHGAVLARGPHTHGALKLQGCKTCHLPHISDFPPLLNKPQPELCVNCHGKALPREEMDSLLLHGALRDGNCSGCHEPHTAEDGKLLRASRDELCAGCHDAVLRDDKGEPWTHLHGPVGAGGCTACHQLDHRHEKSDDRFLLESQPEALCLGCHTMKADHYPSKYSMRFGKDSKECLACHLPHGASNGIMLKKGLLY